MKNKQTEGSPQPDKSPLEKSKTHYFTANEQFKMIATVIKNGPED